MDLSKQRSNETDNANRSNTSGTENADMETHTYEFANIIRRQTKGGAIGMEMIGFVAQIFMVWWDK